MEYGVFIYNPNLFLDPLTARESGQLFCVDGFNPNHLRTFGELAAHLNTINKTLMFSGSAMAATVQIDGVFYVDLQAFPADLLIPR